MQKEGNELFVPGRLCLFGPHSDWAGGHRRQNSEIEKGYVIVAPTNQGNYAKIRSLENPVFRFKSSQLNDSLEVKLDEEKKLLKIANEGGVLSYVAGVAYEIISSYNLNGKGGIEIDNYYMDLPIKKGLSSSASICVLTTKAFDEIYILGLKNKRVMELAYLGETTTPSRCGKMDQACACKNPVIMTFDGDRSDVFELDVGGEFYFLIVDLNKRKDTKKILTDLNKGFPFPSNEFERGKHEYFRENKMIVNTAVGLLKKGNAEELGRLMNRAQKLFDNYLAPACPEELTAPTLHKVISLPEIQQFIYGGQGVGSGGDGTAQILCKSLEDRINAKNLLEMRGLICLELDLKKNC